MIAGAANFFIGIAPQLFLSAFQNMDIAMISSQPREIRYIHAADMHLDRPFAGLPTREAEKLKDLRSAPNQALRRIIHLCEAERPDFLVIAGDAYDQEEMSVSSQLALRDACEKLNSLHIPVFIVHGNHDPLSSRLRHINWPDNVTIFGKNCMAAPVIRDGEIIAFVHGISHAKCPEPENLALRFKRLPDFDGFQLGLLHCAVNAGKDQEAYAPAHLEDLLKSGLDAWALGHVHSFQTLSESPFIAYSGSIQGLHINENGLRGCLSVRAAKSGGVWETSAELRNTAPLVWESISVNIDNVDKIDEVENRILEALETHIANLPPGVNASITRISLEGKTPLNAALRLNSTVNALLDRLASLEERQPALYVKDIQINTRPTQNKEISQRQDLLGEIGRLCEKLADSPQEMTAFMDEAVKNLYGQALARKYLKQPDEAAQRELLRQATMLCQEYLEN